MKKMKLIYAFIVLAVALLGCQDNISLDSIPTTATFEVSQDLVSYPNGNSVIVKNTSGDIPHSFAVINTSDSTVAGYSTKDIDTIHITWKGDYKVVFTACYQGGTYEVTKNVSVTKSDLSLDSLALYLAGSIDGQKVWYLDLDANGVSKYFQGPLYFYGTNDSWESVTNGVAVGGDSWNWCPQWSSNTWLMSAADFGSMTFDLKNGYHVTVVHKTISTLGTQSGIYSFDTTDHTLSLTKAGILHDVGRDAVVTKWGDLKVLSMTNDHMQLAVVRDNSSEGKCLLVYNFISKDYYDSH